MLVTPDLLRAMMPHAGARADLFAGPLSAACSRFDITTPVRVAAFLAQIAHESEELECLVENLNYSAAGLLREWPMHFDAASAAACAHNPVAIANRAYAGRNGNGDELTGDGWKYRGRGLLETSGRRNYIHTGLALGLPLLAQPELLEQPAPAANAAAWFWRDTNCNEPADRGDFAAVTHKINGALTGYADRCVYWERAKTALGLTAETREDV